MDFYDVDFPKGDLFDDVRIAKETFSKRKANAKRNAKKRDAKKRTAARSLILPEILPEITDPASTEAIQKTEN